MNADPLILAVVAGVAFVFALFLVFFFVHVRLWVQAKLTNIPVSLLDIIGMRLRGCPPRLIVYAMIVLHQRGTKVSVREVELCYFAAYKTGASVGTATELVALVEAAQREKHELQDKR
jgi:uncharacterized protein YqfA (UPF0365 family)